MHVWNFIFYNSQILFMTVNFCQTWKVQVVFSQSNWVQYRVPVVNKVKVPSVEFTECNSVGFASWYVKLPFIHWWSPQQTTSWFAEEQILTYSAYVIMFSVLETWPSSSSMLKVISSQSNLMRFSFSFCSN